MGNDLTPAENAALAVWRRRFGGDRDTVLAAVREAVAVTERRFERSDDVRVVLAREVAKKLATALDDIGARIYRDVNPDSSYQPVDEHMAKVLGDFTAYAEEQLAVLDDPAVRAVLEGAKK